MHERFDRAWPSLVALVGTVGVVLLLLFLFGDNTSDDSGDDDAVAGSDDGSGGDAGNDGADDDADGADGENPDPTDEPTDPTDSPDEDSGEDSGDETGEESGDETGDEDGEDPDGEATTAPPELRSPVGIANQTAVTGLETQAQEELEAGGWEVAATSGFNGSVPETTVYYPPGLEESAEALALQFPEIGRVQPSFEGINQTRLVVVLVDDYVDTDDG